MRKLVKPLVIMEAGRHWESDAIIASEPASGALWDVAA
jgi:hypothetical protein